MPEQDQRTRAQRREAARTQRHADETALAQSRTRKRRLAILGGVAALATTLVIVLVASGDPAGERTPTAAPGGQRQTVALFDGIPQHGRTLGSPGAPVTLVEFADPQCPFCAQFARAALPTVVKDYVRTGKVRLEFRPRTFIGPDSVKAAGWVVAAGRQDKLWNVLDMLFADQGTENEGWVTDALLTQVVRAAGADPARARTAAASAGVARELRQADLLARGFGLDTTPAFLIGSTGKDLKPLKVDALTADLFATALDRAGA